MFIGLEVTYSTGSAKRPNNKQTTTTIKTCINLAKKINEANNTPSLDCLDLETQNFNGRYNWKRRYIERSCKVESKTWQIEISREQKLHVETPWVLIRVREWFVPRVPSVLVTCKPS